MEIDKTKYPLLSTIQTPKDFRNFNLLQLQQLSKEVRQYIIDTVTEVGGHFASNLGVVELTIALHYVFDTPKDKLIWDVGHQIYPHKILTGRKERLFSIRKFKGLSGFPKREESIYDLYNTGHAGTSISQLLGEAIARDLKKEDYKCIAVIGDASIGCGMAFEALNHAGHLQTDCIVILNDNDMSISKNVGAINQYLNKIVTSQFYNKWRKRWYQFIYWMPILSSALKFFSEKFEKAVKDFLLPGSLFEDFGFRYIGPINGHNLKDLIEVLDKIKDIKGPILLHVLTQKGKGYQPAEKDPVVYHSISKIDKNNGNVSTKKIKNTISFSEIVGKTLLEIFKKNQKAVAITPAMIEGSGLRELYNEFPDRVFDVGIAEQHSVAFAGALASAEMIPYMCIYSTFLNRAMDQIIQDVALMNLPVRFVIDRGGCVGPDGETHQGLYDLGFLYAIPNIKIYAPANGAELRNFLFYMEEYDSSPIAVRFPKAEELISILSLNIDVNDPTPEIIILEDIPQYDIAILTVGITREIGIQAQKELRNAQISSIVCAIRWVKPVDITTLEKIILKSSFFIFIEDSYEFASASLCILEQLSKEAKGKHLKTFAFPSVPIEHGTRKEIMDLYGINPLNIKDFLLKSLKHIS